MQPKLIVEQKITALVNRYRVYSADDSGEKSELLAFAQQKRLALKEKITFYSDEQKTEEIFSFRAEKVVDVHGKYIIEDASGKKLGTFKKDFKKSLTSSTWHILGNNGQPVITTKESNSTLAIIRRIAGFLPIIGDIAELLVSVFRYHFILVDVAGGKEIGKYQKTKLFRDHYKLSMDTASYGKQDWRVIASLAVALDALQSR